ncbi:MAG: 2-hydroxyacid dehydrogenase [Aristaeellaceae bacterium]
MATILISHGLPTAGLEMLQGHDILMPAPLTAFSKEEMLSLLPQADAVIAGGALDADMIRAGKKLKLIANYGAGYELVDVQTAAACGIMVTNIPEQVTDATAELTIGLMLAASRRIGEMNLRLRQERPESLFGMGRNMGWSLRGRTLGILGMGRIGGRVAVMARALGMNVIAHNRHTVDATLAQPVSLEQLQAQSDVLSIHCPLTAQTRGMVNAAFLAGMKPGALLVNTARGGIVDCDALADALERGQLSCAALDVYPDEPHIPQRLLALPQCVLTPHHGANAADTREGMLRAVCAQILDVLAGRRPVHIVNGL